MTTANTTNPLPVGLPTASVVRVVGTDQNRQTPLTVVRCTCGREHVHRGFGIRRRPCGPGRYLVGMAA